MFHRDERQPQTLRAGLGTQFAEQFLEIAALLKRLFSGNAFIIYPLADLLTNSLCLDRDLEIDGDMTLL